MIRTHSKKNFTVYSIIGFLTAFALAVGLTGCDKTLLNNQSNPVVSSEADTSKASEHSDSAKVSKELESTAEGVAQVVDANNQFALSLYQYVNEHSGNSATNVFFSPYSLSTAMAMLYVSAEGKTKQELQKTFNYPELDILNPNSAKLYQRFNTPHDAYKISTSNNLWLQQGLTPNQRYVDTVKKYYGGEVTNLNFLNDPEGSRKTINDAIKKQTNNMIVNLLPANSIDRNTVTVLTNSVYFKGDWQMPFQPKDTHDSAFHTFDGRQIDTKMMYQEEQVDYYENDQAQVIRLPYKGDDLSMLITLPKDKSKQAMDKLIDAMSVDTLKAWEAELKPNTIDLYLPKFKLEEAYKLKSVLSDMGMPTAFSAGAEFSIFDKNSNINETLYIDDVVHKAVVEVDETGTEAAAATGVTLSQTSLVMTTMFKADHPFMFIIKDNKTDTILFMGQMNRPN